MNSRELFPSVQTSLELESPYKISTVVSVLFLLNEYLIPKYAIAHYITDLHVLLRKALKRQRKRLERPWISKAIVHSIKQKHKLLRTPLYSTDPGKVKKYKAYSNKLSGRITHAAKKNYFS